eukprot:TRINITY_DN108293_c0_g1_i2.p1 TRINITY_DN108293_c0_g1~~TRINITY_DN108293_c0_g1_i2.p1  ORF type:complete len:312 (-),score=63.53 TRINITY_DN108293_c0_g1_i2:25-960(-)
MTNIVEIGDEDETPAGETLERSEGDADGQPGDSGVPNFAELLGPHCVIKRVDKDQKVLGNVKAEEMQSEMMSRASTQKRLGACADHVKGMSRKDKLKWALDLKDVANKDFADCKFEEAARLYNDCLVALDLDGTESENEEVKNKLQLPVSTNLAACLVELGKYEGCIEMCNLALSVDGQAPKALYRRGLCHYRLGNHRLARPDFEAAMKAIAAAREGQDDATCLKDLERRVTHYLLNIRRHSEQEKSNAKRIFERKDNDSRLYDDRPGAREEPEEQRPEVDDSDEAIEAALSRARGDWNWSCCRRSKEKNQ